MKNILIFISLLTSLTLSAQQKGVAPLASPLEGGRGVTRAVVVGISNYQDEGIPDLRFADKDAEAFAQWLRSPAGGSLPDASIRLLLNKDATTGKMITTLDWLIGASKPGDEAIVYFSGHGDVERMTRFQRGYWLTWDSPPAAYAAGAFSLVFLQDIITTLSEVGVQVVVVSDACRAGKLAGSEFGGAQATAAALSKQFANEIKILSCQPEEFSLEGEQWGGGRGCFSYHLVDALYGMADSNSDGVVNLMEVGRYLEEKVPIETAPHQQVPLTVGNRMTKLTEVNAEALALWQQQKGRNETVFTKIESRAQEYLMLAKADTSIQELYAAFTAAIEKGRLMPTDSTAGKSANDYYERLIKEPSIASLHGVMTRNFAAALIDEGQQIVNRFLKGDLKAMDVLKGVESTKAGELTAQFYRAAELLGEKHYFYPKLKAKALYFESYTVYDLPISRDSAHKLDIKLMRQAVALDPVSPHIWGNLATSLPLDSVDFYIEKLNELAPNWPVWYNNIGFKYAINSNHEKAVQYFEKAIALDSNYLEPLIVISYSFEYLGQKDEATRYRKAAASIGLRTLENDSTALSIREWAALADALVSVERFEEAEDIAKKMIANKSTNFSGWYYLGFGYSSQLRYDEAEIAFKKLIALDSTLAPSWNHLGNLYRDMNHHADAVIAFKKAITLDSMSSFYWGQLGRTYFLAQQYSEAERVFKKAISLDSTNAYRRWGMALVHFKTGRLKEARQGFLKVIELDPYYPNNKEARLGMAYTFVIEGKMAEALVYIEQAIQKKATYEELQKDEDLAPLRALPEWEALMKKYFPDQIKN